MTPAADTTTEPAITGMLMLSDDEDVPVDPAKWLYLVTTHETSHNNILVDSGAATPVCQQSLADNLEVNQADLEWNSERSLDISSLRWATRRHACAHETASTWLEPSRAPRRLDFRGPLYKLDKCATDATSSYSAALVERYSTSSLATESRCSCRWRNSSQDLSKQLVFRSLRVRMQRCQRVRSLGRRRGMFRDICHNDGWHVLVRCPSGFVSVAEDDKPRWRSEMCCETPIVSHTSKERH